MNGSDYIKNKKAGAKKLVSSRRFKYGSSAVAFTAIFIVFVLLINVLVSVIASKTGGLYIDMTSKKIYGVTEDSKKALADVTLPVEIIFCRPSDVIESSEYMSTVKRLAESYEKEFSNISVKYHDIFSDPTYFNQYKTTSSDQITDSSVIISCPSNGTSTVYKLDNFYKVNTSGKLFAFDGENKITTAILRAARPQTLKAAFTKGHGETVSKSLMYLLTEQGYEVSQIDLKTATKEEINSLNLIVICNPTNDFTGLSAEKEGQVNEIGLLNSYLTGSFGNLMVFLSPEMQDLPEFSEFLSEDWGVSYTPGAIMHEDERNSVSNDGYAVLGTFSEREDTAGYALHKDISSGTSGARAIFDYSVPLEITFNQNNYKTVSAAVLTSSSSTAVNGSQSKACPSSPLLVMSDYSRSYDSADKHAYVMVCASSLFLNYIPSEVAYAGTSQYANSDLVKSALKLMGNANIAANIDFKVLDESDISVTRSEAQSLMRKLGIIFPVIICAAGIAVFFKRKYL